MHRLTFFQPRQVLFLIVALFTCGELNAQTYTPLYGGSRLPSELHTIDTTGGDFTIVSMVDVTLPSAESAILYGLSRHPGTGEIYALYQTGGAACSRRLGIIDVETGVIDDIGDVENLNDIEFGPDATLYGNNGANCADDYAMVEINILTGATTTVLTYVSGTYGSSITYNPFDGFMYYMNDDIYSKINLATMTEISDPTWITPGEVQAFEFINANEAWVISYEERYRFDLTTNDFVSDGGVDGLWYLGLAYNESNVASVPTLQLEEFSVFPNPTNGEFTIQLQGDFTYEVTTVDGEIIVYGVAVNSEQLSLEGVAPGVYFVNLSTEAGVTTQKLIKQ